MAITGMWGKFTEKKSVKAAASIDLLGPWSPRYDNLRTKGREVFQDAKLQSLADFHERLHPEAPNALQVEMIYAQHNKIYNNRRIVETDAQTYANTPEDERVNKFDRVPTHLQNTFGEFASPYKKSSTWLWLDERLAKIVSDAATHLHTKGQMLIDGKACTGATLVGMDGLRTVDAGYVMAAANPDALKRKLLAKPGYSAHNKAQAFDCGVFVRDGNGELVEVNMLGHVDHSDMQTNHRNYEGLSEEQRHNRLTLERAFMRAALDNDTVIAPLREEWWDFRFPERPQDLWRVLESVARCIDDKQMVQHFSQVIEESETLQRTLGPDAIPEHLRMDYQRFKGAWQIYFGNEKHQALLKEHLGEKALQPPCADNIVYHGIYNPIYDDGRFAQRSLANPELFEAICASQKKAVIL